MTEYLGFSFVDAGLDGVRSLLNDALARGAYGYVVTPNVDHVVQYHRGSRDLVRTYDEAMFQVCDSRVLARLARLSGSKLIPTPGSDLTESLLREPLQNGREIAVIGPDREAFEALQRRYPDLSLTLIDSHRRLDIGSPDWVDTVERAREARWDVLLVCLSFPKQEFFARDLGRAGRLSGIALCVGASIDFLTGRQKRAPRAVQRMGLEWLHRLASNPRRMYERYLVRGPAVFLLAAKAGRERGRSVDARSSSSWTAPRRVLFLTTALPHEQQTGGEICSMNFIDVLKAAGCAVDVLGYQRAGSVAPLPEGFFSPRELLIESGNSRMQTARWFGEAMLTGRPFSVQKFVTREMARSVEQRLQEVEYDLVIIDHAQMEWILSFIPERMAAVHIAHNAESRLYSAQGEDNAGHPPNWRSRLRSRIYLREGQQMMRMERRFVGRFREIWTLTDDDALVYRELGGGKTVRAFDVPAKAPPPPGAVAPAQDVGLLGNWIWSANGAGLEWFLKGVVPLLSPQTDIVVAGRAVQAAGTKAGNVRFAGFVPDATEFLRASRVVAIPSTTGSGVQIKTIETLALGVPAVATPLAMRGLGDVPDSVRVCRDEQEMAQGIEELLVSAKVDAEAGRRWWSARRVKFDEAVREAVGAVLPRSGSPARPAAPDELLSSTG